MTTDMSHGRRLVRARRIAAAAGCAGLLAIGSGATHATSAPDGTGSVDSAAPAEPVAIAVTLTGTSIDGLPTDLAAGLVDVAVTDETEGGGGELNFTLVEPGTDVAAFTEGLTGLFAGGPFPAFFLDNAGISGHTITALDAGEYIVWMDNASNLDRPSTVEDIVAVPLTVGPGDDDAVIPPTDGGAIRGGDYLFDVDVVAGGTTVVFTNSSDNQFHHVVILDFGSNDPVLVEQHLPEVLASDGEGPMPEGIDADQITEAGGSGVFGPGSSGTFDAALEAGHTYVALCFIQDRDGGLPHAIQHQMHEVFQL